MVESTGLAGTAAAPTPEREVAARDVLDAQPFFIAVLDGDGVIREANRAWRHLAAAGSAGADDAASAVIGVDYLAACAAAQGVLAGGADQACQGVLAVLRRRVPEFRMEYSCPSASGSRWFVMMVSPVDVPAGGAVVTLVDSTKRKQAEEAARASEARFRAVVEDQTEVICRVAADGRVLFVNEVYCRIFAKAERDLIGQRWQPLAHPDDLPVIEAQLARLSPAQPVVVIENRIFDGAGRLRWMQFVNRASFDANGALREIQAVGRDITERKAAEEAARASEARFRAAVEDQTELICRIRADGLMLFVNPAVCRFFGKTEGELVGQFWQPRAHPDDLPMIEAQLARLSPAQPVVEVENRLFDGTGTWRWMHFVNRALYDGSGTLREILAVGRDIGERKAIEARQQALLEENTRMGQQMIRMQETERTEIARELHDELSQQLAAIRVLAGAIRRGGARDAAKLAADAAAIEEVAGQIYAVSHRLIEGLHPQLLDSAGLEAALRALFATWAMRHAEVRIRFRAGALARNIDAATRIHLFRIAQESLANVARHANAGAVRLFLGESGHGDRRRLRLVIRDDGVGMDTGAQRHGYGLIIMRERAHALGGELALSSRPGRGVRVAVDVPRGAADVRR